MRSSRLDRVLEHGRRLTLLCCLLDDEPLKASQLAARLNESPAAVRYSLGELESVSLVEKRANPGGREPLYVATLDAHPDPVREEVEDLCLHRRQLESE